MKTQYSREEESWTKSNILENIKIWNHEILAYVEWDGAIVCILLELKEKHHDEIC